MSEWIDDLARDLNLTSSESRRVAAWTRRGVVSRLLGAFAAVSSVVVANALPVNAGKGGDGGGGGGNKCKNNNDCNGDKRCRDGKCEPKNCKNNNDCGPNKRCRDGDCEPIPNDGGGGNGGGSNAKLSAERLRNADANQIEQRAQNDADFNQIREYFAHEDGRDWNQVGGDAFRLNNNGKRMRDAFWITLRNPKGDQWVHVMYGREDSGAENAVGLLWRGDGKKGKFTNVFYVQNGHIRNDEGRVDGAEPRGGDISWPNDLDQAVCPVVTKGSCLVGTGVTAGFCMLPVAGIPACVGASGVVATCWEISDTAEEACRTIDGS